MNDAPTAKVLIDKVQNSLDQLEDLWSTASSNQDLKLYQNRLSRWKNKWANWLEVNITKEDAERFSTCDSARRMMWVSGNNYSKWEYPEIHYKSFKAFLVSLKNDLEEHPEDFEAGTHGSPTRPLVIPETVSKEIFIVHGHDGTALAELKELLREELGITPRILSQQAAQGRTILEKFEQEASTCGYAIVLMTPDDQVTADDDSHYQARPNVIFELGWFYGRLGRKNVCILSKHGTEIHSDIAGVNRIEFRRSVDEAFLKIKKELKSSRVLQEKSS